MKTKVAFTILLFLLLIPFASAWAGDYVIGAGDELRVSVWGVPELSVDVVVRPDGKITLPAAGDVMAAGLTPANLGDEISRQLTRFVKKPVVTLSVTKITNNRVYISGGGVPSQVVSLPERTTLFKLLCQLEGLQNADLLHAYLLRNGKKLPVDFYALFIEGQLDKDIELQPEDIVFLPNNDQNKVYVIGAVKEPKYIYFHKGLRVLDAILDAGGFNEFADKNDVTILRFDKKMKISLKIKKLMSGKNVGENILLEPRDYVVVEDGGIF